MKKKLTSLLALLCGMAIFLTACSNSQAVNANAPQQSASPDNIPAITRPDNMPAIGLGEAATEKNEYTDRNGDTVIIPEQFKVSTKEDEQIITSGLVVIGPDESEFVWVPITETEFARNDFGSNGYWDDTSTEDYIAMEQSVREYGGFYMGRYEASYASGDNISNYIPASKKSTINTSETRENAPGRIWTFVPSADMIEISRNMYQDNSSVESFLPWGINWDTTLQWIIDSGDKTEAEVTRDSTSWGNYSNDEFSGNASAENTGQWEETKANNIYDLAGNNWEWTQELYGTEGNHAVRGGSYSFMGRSCTGADCPATARSNTPDNDHHPNLTFRVALYLK